MDAIKQHVLNLPAAACRGLDLRGFGMDIGGTLIKVAYAECENDQVKIHFLTYHKDRITEALKSIKEALSRVTQPGAEVTTTGVGCNKYANEINEILNVRIKNVPETDCNVRALQFLNAHFKLSEITLPIPDQVQSEIKAELELFSKFDDMIEAQKASFEQTNVKPDSCQEEPLTNPNEGGDILYPCLMSFLGSGAFNTVINADGSNMMVNVNTSCGRMFVGLGSFITGAKTFDELISLAEKGDDSVLETKCKHVRNADTADIYALLPDDTPIYAFGNALGKHIDEVKPEDTAAALVSQLTQSLATNSALAQRASNAKTVIFAGTVCSESQLIRDKISRFFATNQVMNADAPNYYFLKYGAHIGALGALLLGSQ